MKLKYYLRGVGTGILFATIILLVSYAYKMSDGQIKKKALELGMVYPTEEQSSSNVTNNQTGENQSGEKDSVDKPSKEDSGNEESSNGETTTKKPEVEEPTTTKPITDEPTTTKPTIEEPTTEEPTTEKTTSGDNTEVTCIITVTNRTNSYHVSIQLAQAGIIESADEFNNYLISNGYAYRIQNGTFTFKKGMTYKEMAEYHATGRL